MFLKHYKEGKKLTRKLFKNNFTLYFKYMIFIVASLITKVSIIFYPLGRLTEEEIVTNLKDYRTFRIDKLFIKIEDKERAKNVFLLYSIKIILFLSVLTLAYIIKVLTLMVFDIIDFSYFLDTAYMEYYVRVPAFIFAFIIITHFYLVFEMATTLVVNEDIKVSKAITIGIETMKIKNRFKLFLVYFINLLEASVVALIGVLVVNFISMEFSFVIGDLFLVLIIIIMLFVVTKKMVSIGYIKRLVLEDILVDFSYKETEDVSFEKLREEKLTSLFETTKEVI